MFFQVHLVQNVHFTQLESNFVQLESTSNNTSNITPLTVKFPAFVAFGISTFSTYKVKQTKNRVLVLALIFIIAFWYAYGSCFGKK